MKCTKQVGKVADSDVFSNQISDKANQSRKSSEFKRKIKLCFIVNTKYRWELKRKKQKLKEKGPNC